MQKAEGRNQKMKEHRTKSIEHNGSQKAEVKRQKAIAKSPTLIICGSKIIFVEFGQFVAKKRWGLLAVSCGLAISQSY